MLVNPRAMVLTGGSGADTVTADNGANRFVAGSGSLDVTGGPGAAAYVLHAGGGSLTVEDFDPGKGDTLTVDQALQGALVQASDGHGGTLLAFGAKQGSIDLINHATVSPSAIHFI
jgi:Ca2+-binding RTX toxin-like protein